MPKPVTGARLRQGSAAPQKLFALLAGAALGTAVFLLLYGTVTLHVTYDAWILNGYDETDIQQHYAGWVAFRNAHWAFPLGLADTLAWPDGTLISFTDSLPWVSIFFKLLRGVLPGTFQYFGWYTLLCFALQGAAGALLCGRIALWNGAKPAPGGYVFTALGGLLFACLPTLWERAFRHVALASQYLFLFALYFYLEYRTRLRVAPPAPGGARFPWQLALLGFAAVGVHPYFLPLVMICALLAAVETARTARRPARGAAQFVACLGAALFGGWLIGAVGGGVSASRAGYGELSMNLNAPFNPISRGGYRWSCLLPGLPQLPSQYDGFNYLGLGVLCLALAGCVIALVGLARRRAAGGWWRRNAPLAAACLFLTLFAATNRLSWNSAEFALPMPGWLTELCGIFRSSGRMFYLVGACIVLLGIGALWRACARAKRGAALAAALLALAVAVQGWDLSAVAAQKRAVFTQPINATVVNDDKTQNLGAGHTKLLCADPALRQDRTRLLALLAAKQGLATNIAIAVSGDAPGAAASVQAAAQQLAGGSFDPDTVYVTTDESQYNAWQVQFTGAAVQLFPANSCYFLVPDPG